MVFTREARKAVARTLRSWKPRLSEASLEAIMHSLAEVVLDAKFAFREGTPVEVIGLRRRLERMAALSKRLRRDLDLPSSVEGQISLVDLMRLEGAPSLRELAHALAVLERAIARIKPGRRPVGHPKAGTTGTRYLAAQTAGILQKHGIRPSAEPGSVYERIVRAMWRCVETSPPPNSMKRFLRSFLA